MPTSDADLQQKVDRLEKVILGLQRDIATLVSRMNGHRHSGSDLTSVLDGLTTQDEAVDVGRFVQVLNFAGAGVTVTHANNTSTITIP